jgi:uncharacterized SAM-dependent methyltransferase
LYSFHAQTLQRRFATKSSMGLQKPQGQRTLPTILLYDEQGLRLYDEITTKVPEYYLFPAEEEILREHGSEIVRLMHGGQARSRWGGSPGTWSRVRAALDPLHLL